MYHTEEDMEVNLKIIEGTSNFREKINRKCIRVLDSH